MDSPYLHIASRNLVYHIQKGFMAIWGRRRDVGALSGQKHEGTKSKIPHTKFIYIYRDLFGIDWYLPFPLSNPAAIADIAKRSLKMGKWTIPSLLLIMSYLSW